MSKKQRAIFLKINGHAKNRKQKVNLDSQSEYMSERLVWLKDVEFIRTSVKRKNFVDYVLVKKVKELEYLSKEITLKKLLEELPDYFVQVNRGEILNMLYITGKSQRYIFTVNRNFKIGKTYMTQVNQIINSFLVEETQQ